MNRMVNSWNRAELPEYDGRPDSVSLEGETKVFEGEMAERQNTQDIVKVLPRHHFRNIIRMIHRMPLAEVQVVRSATYTNLKRLAVRRDTTKAVMKIPRGSDQINVRSIVDWIRRLNKTDDDAISQLVAIDATACSRG